MNFPKVSVAPIPGSGAPGAARDMAHYPDIDLHCRRRRGERGFQDKQGRWYPGWPKESKR